jgi:hypothetical protein
MLITFNAGVFRMMCISGDVRKLRRTAAPVRPLLIVRVAEMDKVELGRPKKNGSRLFWRKVLLSRAV